MKLPALKKKISGFLLEENGRISKQSMLSLSAIIAGLALGTSIKANKALAHVHSPLIDVPPPIHSSHASY